MADILETATQADGFKTLLTAVEVAGLVDVLKAEGPFTLLAPTDDVFAKLPSDELTALMADTHKLKRVLSYHVLFGDVRSEDFAETDEAPTLEGSIVAIDHTNGIKVNEASVTQADILADNGVIHVIDALLMPTMLVAES